MDYVVTFHTPESNKGISKTYDLDILPTNITKLNQFANSFNLLLGEGAKVTEIKAVVATYDKPVYPATTIPNAKVMYTTSLNKAKNCQLPYLKKTVDKTDIKGFIATYFQDYRSLIDISYKRSFK